MGIIWAASSGLWKMRLLGYLGPEPAEPMEGVSPKNRKVSGPIFFGKNKQQRQQCGVSTGDFLMTKVGGDIGPTS